MSVVTTVFSTSFTEYRMGSAAGSASAWAVADPMVIAPMTSAAAAVVLRNFIQFPIHHQVVRNRWSSARESSIQQIRVIGTGSSPSSVKTVAAIRTS
ncbi:hypothetical protein [Nocardia asiatica]|uniref:hypothetical protein n=1 Tax=Nocardia asiatica TaxID=209252 RepID=UPI003EE35311